MKLSGSNIKIFPYVFSKESSSYTPENGTPKKIPYVSGNGTFIYFRKLLTFHGVTFQAQKMKKLLIFYKMELFSSKLKKLFIFQKRTCKA